jgi:hypothetical protein
MNTRTSLLRLLLLALLGLPLILYASFLLGGKVLDWGSSCSSSIPGASCSAGQIRAGH